MDFQTISDWLNIFAKIGGLGLLYGIARAVDNRYKTHQAQQRDMIDGLHETDMTLKAGIVGLLHHDIYQLCNHYLAAGYISTDDLDDLNYLFRSYKALGGNGTGEALYNRVLELPIKNFGGNDKGED